MQPSTPEEHSNPPEQIPQKIYEEDGIYIPQPDSLRAPGGYKIRDADKIAEAQKDDMYFMYCRRFEKVLRPHERTLTQPLADPNNYQEKYKAYKKLTAELVPQTRQQLDADGVFAPTEDFETGKPLPDDSLKLLEFYKNQQHRAKDGNPITQEQLQKLQEEARTLSVKYDVPLAKDDHTTLQGDMYSNLANKTFKLKMGISGFVWDAVKYRYGQYPELQEAMNSAKYNAAIELIDPLIEEQLELEKLFGKFIPPFNPQTMKRYSPYSLSRLHLVQNLDQHPLTEAQKNLQREYLLKEVEEKQQEKQIFTPGEVFDPKTAAAEISQLPKEARADALRDYYNKFQHQMFGWSSFTEFITEQAIMDPDLTDAEFEKALNTYKNLFAFSDSHVNLAQVFQERYKTKREAITQVTQEYGTDQQALSKAIFGREYNKLQIYPTPLAFICFTSDNPTFNQIYGGDNRQSSGYTLGTVYNPNLSHQVIVIRDNADPDPQMVKHELQHTLYELFPHPYGNLEVDPLEVGRVVDAFQQNTQTPTRLEQIKIAISKKLGKENGPNPAIQPETLLNQLLEKVQEGGLGLVHNELLAYFKQGVDPEFVTQMLHASPQNQLYGYFNTFYSTTYQDMLSHLDEESQHTIRRATHQVLHDGYNKTITAAVDAMHRLMAEGNYNRDQVIGSLRSYPASEWPKTVNRLLKGEGNK